MKFLILRKPRFVSGMMASSATIREHKRAMAEAIKTGTIDCLYAFPGGGGSVAIANTESVEQLNERLMASPLFLYSEFEVRALTDYDKYMENVAAALEKQGR